MRYNSFPAYQPKIYIQTKRKLPAANSSKRADDLPFELSFDNIQES